MCHASQPLGIESLPLVERLFADLVTTTQSYEGLNEKTRRAENELAVANNSVYPLKKENTRMLQENNKVRLLITFEIGFEFGSLALEAISSHVTPCYVSI